jgi:DNA-binding beta-propeller fold protein YncE
VLVTAFRSAHAGNPSALGNVFPLYVSFDGQARIVAVDANGKQTDFSSDNSQQGMNFFNPQGVALDANGNLYVGDYVNNQILKLDGSGNQTIFYRDPSNAGRFFGLAFDAAGNLYAAN